MLFKFEKDFAIISKVFSTISLFRITATDTTVELNAISDNGNSTYKVTTVEELMKFKAKVESIVYGKFSDEYTPNEDILYSFKELYNMFHDDSICLII